MKLQFLGTAAAEGIPALFCNCPACQYAYKTGGKEIRMRAGAMLDDVIKIDFGPDSYAQMLANHLDYTRVHTLLVTHSHPDHLAVDELGYRQPSFSHLTDERMLTVYGNAAVGKKIAPRLSARIGFQQLTAFETMEIEGYQVTPLQAVHYLHREPNPPQENLVTFEGKTYSRCTHMTARALRPKIWTSWPASVWIWLRWTAPMAATRPRAWAIWAMLRISSAVSS